MNGIVYCTTNLIDSKKYIGYHSGNNDKYLGSNIHLKNAIKKYGRKNFIRETLQDGLTNIQDLQEAEIYWIDYFGADQSDLFYNITKGGEGNPEIYKTSYRKKSEEHKKNIGLAQVGHKMSEKTRLAIRKSKLGVKYSEESKKIMSLRKIQDIGRAVVQLDKENNFIAEFKSLSQAAKSLNKGSGNIANVVLGKNKTAHGFKWMYLENYKKLQNGK